MRSIHSKILLECIDVRMNLSKIIDPFPFCFPVDKPNQPGEIDIVSVTKDCITIHWLRPEHDGGKEILGYWIEFRQAGESAWKKCNKERSKDRQFTMGGLMEATEYEFRVFAENETGLKDIQDVTTKLGESGTLTCGIIGRPLPEIKWYRFGKELIQSRKYKMSSDGRNHSLSILTDEQEDEGLYTCRAINEAGEIESSGKLRLQAAPQFHPGFPLKEKYFAGAGTSLRLHVVYIGLPAKIYLPQELQGMGAVHAVRGDHITIKIPISGKPEPTITWQKGQEILSNSPYHQVITTRSFTSLVFQKGVQRKDTGYYIITAKNRFGMDKQTIEVNVADIPEAPKGLVVSEIARDSITLVWEPPVSDGGSNIINYIVEKCPTTSDRWIRAGQTTDCSITIINIFGKAKYQFRVIAENQFGLSPPSEPTEPITTKEDKSVIRNYDEEVDETREITKEEALFYKVKELSSKYIISEELAHCQFGVVHRCIEIATKKTYMAKFIKVKGTDRELVLREIEALNVGRHKNIIYLHEYFESMEEIILIFEFISGVDIFERLGTSNFELTEQEIVKYLRQVCSALKFLHSHNFGHFDIRPDNIVYTTRKSTNIKIIEMGQARLLVPGENIRMLFSAPEYCAPEVHRHDLVTTATDMWSVGVMAYVLLSGLNPFAAESTTKMIENITNCEYVFDSEAFKDISLEAMDFVDRLLVKDRKLRMTAHEALEHPWLKMKIEHISNKAIRTLRHRRYYQTLVKRVDTIVSAARVAYGGAFKNQRGLAVGKFGEDSCKARLTVAPHPVTEETMKPMFKRLLANVECMEGQSVHFELRVSGVPPPTLKWQKDGHPLQFGPKVVVIQEDVDSHVLHIRETLLEDSGVYKVTATNSAGTASCQATLKVDRLTYTRREYRSEEEK
uniref:Myosin, light chain kinase a n=1 Tax=Astatotilapia calliptera TaxID=8154 RepID=A0A3P8P0Y4_ASTCA